MVKPAILKFKDHLSKLSENQFTTIRRRKFKVATIYNCKSPMLPDFDGACICIMQGFFGNLDDELLIQDTDTSTREEAIKYLNSLYKTPIENNEVVTVLWLHKLTEEDKNGIRISNPS